MENTIRIGGVPEHFNLPIHLAIENNAFESRGVRVEWKTFAGGTGQMTAALRNDEVDVCILLTEGIISDIIEGSPSKIVSNFVTSPLCWGVHTGADNPLEDYEAIFDKKYAISRYGSGSHLMAMVDANGKEHAISSNQFYLIDDLAGALVSLKKQETDVFYWEKFTTKPYVDAGALRCVGEFYTPWSCFVIAATDKIIAEQPENLIRTLRTIFDTNDAFMQNERAAEMVSERYALQKADADRWFHATEWAIHGWVSDKMLKSVVYSLKTAGIIEQGTFVPELIWRRE